MTAGTNLDEAMNRFRLASRELFNNYFKLPGPSSKEGWQWEGRFSEVEAVLYHTLVGEPASLSSTRYGELQPDVLVELSEGFRGPVMVNRGVDSGYWDDPTTDISNEVRLLFVRFFDWNLLGYRDNRYVRVHISEWDAHPELVGRHALIESQYVHFVKISPN